MAEFIARCRLTLHDYLYYASREMGRLYETEKYLHNYGLTYALGLVQPAPAYFQNSQVPRYQQELTRVNLYVTPARPLRLDFSFNTFKMATVPYYSFTPQVTENRVVYGRAKELAPGSTFEFFVLAPGEVALPKWVRLGKWMAKAQLYYKWYKVGSEAAALRQVAAEQPQEAACPLNPLDLPARRVFSYDVITMPPVSLLANPSVSGRCCLLKADTKDEEFKDTKRADLLVPLDMAYFAGSPERTATA